ncbi:acetate--CoA ligase family protein [Candidimonas nitroreducens]|uniref:acetate--CoA ligase family protein n=1 Tax=Candidimonas nitroreducens TaxID=683354 RepID=UPI00130315F5|nr:acetate--CoA ligase family protein [Candidimonas nitroreducens]
MYEHSGNSLDNDRALAQAFLRPRGVALIGASGDPKKITSRPQRFLRAAGYAGRVVPVNPGRDEVLGEQAYRRLVDAPGEIDHAFIMVAAPEVPDAIRQCAEKGVRVATIFSAGFAELGDAGMVLQQEVLGIARDHGVRILGPNCLGLVNVQGHIPLTANAVVEQETLVPGFLSVVSQSGSMLGTLLSRAQSRGLGFSKLVSVGNECDLAVGDIANMLVDDPDTGVILLFLETFRDADRLARAARRAHDAGKPIIAYKLGRSTVGRTIANSHTGAIVGADDVANAYFRDHGIIRVETMEGLIEAPQLVLGHRPPRTRRVGVISGTGGVAAMVVDRLGVLGTEVAGPPQDMRERLSARGIEISSAPLTDIPMGGSEGGRYSAILSELLASDHCDAVVSVIGSSARTNPQVIVDRVLNAAPRDRKPLAVFLGPKAEPGLAMLQQNGVAGFNTPESCADAVHAYLEWRAPAIHPSQSLPAAAAALAAELGAGSKHEQQAARLFSAAGVPMAPNCVLRDAAQRPPFDGPYAVKLLSGDIPHKTDAGMVRLGVRDEDVREVVGDMLERAARDFPAARVEGVLVQPMVSGLAEVIVGYRRDPEVGPVVMLAMGGVTAELTKSRSVRIAPVSVGDAMGMIDEIPELAVLRGYRNLPAGDCEALARAIAAMSSLAEITAPVVEDAEANPLIVKEKGNGVLAVDSLVTLALPPAKQ